MTCLEQVVTFRKVKTVNLHEGVKGLKVALDRDRSPSLDMCLFYVSLPAQSTCSVSNETLLSPIPKSSIVSSGLLWNLKTPDTIRDDAFLLLVKNIRKS